MTPAEFRAARQRLGWSVKTCAEKLGYKPDTIYRFEQGTRTITPRVVSALNLWITSTAR